MQDSGTPPAPRSKTAQPHARSSVWHSLSETFQYLWQARNDKSIVIRDQDRISMYLVTFAFGFAVLFMIAPIVSPQFRALSFSLTVVADILYMAALMWFVFSRFGILRTMTKRDAWICWQLMVGTGILSVLMAANLGALILMSFMGGRINLGG